LVGAVLIALLTGGLAALLFAWTALALTRLGLAGLVLARGLVLVLVRIGHGDFLFC